MLSEVEQVADRLAIMRKGRLMHVEDMHERRNQRMILLRFAGSMPENVPDELMLTVRERNDDVILLEHRGEPGPLLTWLGSQNLADIAIGTEDLSTLYNQFHGPNVKEDAAGEVAD